MLCGSSVCRTKIIPFFPEHYQKGILKQFNGRQGLLQMVNIFIVTFQNWIQWNRALFAPLQVKFSWESRNCFRLPVYYSNEPKLLSSLYLILLSWRWILIKFVKLGSKRTAVVDCLYRTKRNRSWTVFLSLGLGAVCFSLFMNNLTLKEHWDGYSQESNQQHTIRSVEFCRHNLEHQEQDGIMSE